MSETPRLSPSIAKVLLDKSPKHAWQAHRLLGGEAKEPTAAQLKGSAVDALVFGGTVPKISAAAMADATKLAGHVRDELDKREITGIPQHRLEWHTYGVECSGVIDLDDPIRSRFFELKTSHDLSDANIVKQIELYRYDLQVAAYQEALGGLATPCFIFAETAPPYDVRFVTVTGDMLARGTADWRRAVNLWRKCMDSNEWPGRGDFTADVSSFRKKQDADKWVDS